MIRNRSARDVFLTALIGLSAFLVFRAAPVQQLHDSKYTMLLAENLLRHRDFDLARYDLPADDYRLRSFGTHRYYFFPVGAAILSTPFVEAMRLRGLSTVRADGSYDERGELVMDKRVAAALMAGFAALAYATARLVLPELWSVGIAAVAAFGTQIFSTASRSVWSDTWGVLLVGAGTYLLLRAVARRAPTSAFLVATAFALAYVVRPTNAVALAGAGAYLLATDRRGFVRFAATVAVILGLFVAHSWALFGAPLPPYFSGSRLDFHTPGMAIAGNLLSPSRGLLVYVPAVVALGLALVRYRTALRFRGLLILAAFVVIAHFAVLAGFWDWWGGHSYGPRLTTGLVPWLVLLAVLAADDARTVAASRGTRPADTILAAATGILCIVGVALNAVGAFSWEADRWNVVPDNINDDRARLWSWSRPQFLAPVLPDRSATGR